MIKNWGSKISGGESDNLDTDKSIEAAKWFDKVAKEAVDKALTEVANGKSLKEVLNGMEAHVAIGVSLEQFVTKNLAHATDAVKKIDPNVDPGFLNAVRAATMALIVKAILDHADEIERM